jgi:hypothetical protein
MKYRGKNLAIATNSRTVIAEASQPVTSDIAKSVFFRHPNPESIRQVIPELSGTPIRNQTGRFG